MSAKEEPSALAAALRRAGVPWYASMLAEADLTTPEAVRAGGADALAEAGVEPQHMQAIFAELQLEAELAEREVSAVPESQGAGPSASGAACAAFTRGGLYSPEFLRVVAPLYEQAMGAENLGPLLYSLVRFTKPHNVLELGAGCVFRFASASKSLLSLRESLCDASMALTRDLLLFTRRFTSLFLLQALADNDAECALAKEAAASAPGGVPWLTPAFVGANAVARASVLHVVDNMAHEHTSAHRVQAASEQLGISSALRFYNADALDADASSRLAISPGGSDGDRAFGLVWIDLGAAHRLRALVDSWWPRVDPAGGMLVVHSTLTNEASRVWLEHMRAASADSESFYGRFELLSLLEPHKCFQNSLTMLRRRGGGPGGIALWDEPVYSRWP